MARPAAAALLLVAAVLAPCRALHSRARGHEILVDGKPLVFKGVNWNPVAVGKTQSQGVDFRGFVEADSALMAAAGINAIRTYSPITDTEVLDILWRKGIHVLNTVYVAAGDKVSTAEEAVRKVKDHPAILMWCIGNEWNYNRLYSSTMLFEDALARVDEVSKLIKRIDSTHLVASIYGHLPPPDLIKKLSDVDLWGLTVYTGISFGSLFDLWGQRTGKPLFIAEFGADAYNAKSKVEDEAAQAKATSQLAREIAEHSVQKGGVCTGGLLFELADEWWKDAEGSPDRQDVGGVAPGGGPYPDHVFNEEFWGLVKIDGSPRQAFGAYAALPPVGKGADRIGAGFRLRACGASPRCNGMLGDCCPTREGKLLGCCSDEAREAAEGGSGEEEKGAPGEEACVIEHNYDYLGGDLQSFRNVASAQDCAKLCSANPLCESFTYGKVGYFRQSCYLKSMKQPRRRADTCCDSGLPCRQEAAAARAAPSTSPPSTTVPEESTTAAQKEAAAASTAPSTSLPSTTMLEKSTTAAHTQPATTPAPATAPTSTTLAKARAGREANRTARTSEACEIDRNHDYRGDDLASILYVTSAETCATLCSAHPSCKSYTYAKKIHGCFLKSSARPFRTPSDCCDSGLPCAQACLMEQNYDYSGDDFADIANVESAEACAKLCGKNPECKSFTYGKLAANTQVCYLKDSIMPGRTASSCCDSGLPCAPAPPPPPSKGREASPTPAPLPAPAPAAPTEPPAPEGDWVDVQVTSRHEFVASISVGSPPQELRCLIDSGSADLWIPSERCRTCGSQNTFEARSSKSFAAQAQKPLGSLGYPKSVTLTVDSGEIIGYPVQDTVSLGSIEVKNQSFIIVEDSTMPPQRSWDGICGLAWRQLGMVHHPLYSRMQEQGRRALFALVPQGPGHASLVVGAVPHSEIKEGTLVWVRAESFQPGTMSSWVQRSFWVTTGGLRIHAAKFTTARFLIDTGVSEVLLAPPKHYINLVNSLLPLGDFAGKCSIDHGAGHEVTCDCSVRQEKLSPLQIHLGGQPFLLRVEELFAKVEVDGQERCRLQARPNPKASSSQADSMEGLGGLFGGLMTGILSPRAGGPGVPQTVPQTGAQSPGIMPSTPQTVAPPAHLPARPAWMPQLAGLPVPGTLAAPSQRSAVPGEKAGADSFHVRQRRLGNDWRDLLQPSPHNLLSQSPPQANRPIWAEVDDPLDELWVLGGGFARNCVIIFDFDKDVLGFAKPTSMASEKTRLARARTKASQRLDEAAPIVVAGASTTPLRPWSLLLAAAIASLAAALALVAASGGRRSREGSSPWWWWWRATSSYASLNPPRQMWLEDAEAHSSEDVWRAEPRLA